MNDAPEIVIRPAGPADVAALAQLRHDFRAENDPTTEAKAHFLARCSVWMTVRLAPGSPWHCWAAEDTGRLVGSIWLQIIEKIPNPAAEAETHGYISNLYVEPRRRGAGIGSSLMDTCLQFCEEKVVDAVILWPTLRSRSLYERHGFAVSEGLLELPSSRSPARAR